MTEIQAGTYVVMDNFHGQMVPGFEHSLTIQATVISRQSGKVIVDAGNKSVADPADVTMVGHDHKVFRFDEEHGIFDAAGGSPLRVGDPVALVPGYSPSTVNWYDAYHVVHEDIVRGHLADHPARSWPSRDLRSGLSGTNSCQALPARSILQ